MRQILPWYVSGDDADVLRRTNLLGNRSLPNLFEETAFGNKKHLGLELELVNTKACRWILSDLIVLRMCIYVVLPECRLSRLISPVPLTEHCYCPYVLLYRRCVVGC